jgi:hypothetical protein
MIIYLTAVFQGVLILLHVNKTIHDVLPEDGVDVQSLKMGLHCFLSSAPAITLRAFFCNSRILLQPEECPHSSNPYLMCVVGVRWGHGGLRPPDL